jgi:tetratricopeptide (TPR) repeat protein
VELLPNYYYVHLNLGICHGGMGHDKESEEHYKRAVELSPNSAEPYIYYAFFLKSRMRLPEAQQQLETAVRVYPGALAARHILIQMYYQSKKTDELRQMVQDTLKLDPRDEVALRFQGMRPGENVTADAFTSEGNIGGLPPAMQELVASMKDPAKKGAASGPQGPTPEQLLNLSSGYCKGGNYDMCLGLAKQAVDARPLWAEAYNNVAAAYLAMGRWDEGIQAATQALQIKPDFQDARDNLQYALTHRQQALGK